LDTEAEGGWEEVEGEVVSWGAIWSVVLICSTSSTEEDAEMGHSNLDLAYLDCHYDSCLCFSEAILVWQQALFLLTP
jgi:hypothetical protein